MAGHHATTTTSTDQWMSLGETVEFLPAATATTTSQQQRGQDQRLINMQLGLDGLGRGDSNNNNNGKVLMNDAEIRKWAAQQLQKNRDQQDAMRRVGESRHRRNINNNDRENTDQSPPPQDDQQQHRNLEYSSSSSTSSSSSSSASAGVYKLSPFVEGESDYDEYQQAWRLLGFMIDCDDDVSNWMTDDYYNQQGNDNNHNSRDNQGTGNMCTRYVLWAAVRDICAIHPSSTQFVFLGRLLWRCLACVLARRIHHSS